MAAWRRLAALGQTAADFAQRQAFLNHPGKNLLHDARLFDDDLVPRFAATGLLADVTIAIRCAGQHADATGEGRVQLAASTAFADLGSFILGDDPLHLQQEIVFGTFPDGVPPPPRPSAAASLRRRAADTKLCGGSAFTRWTGAPAKSLFTSSGSPLSLQHTTWLPSTNRSPGCVIALSSVYRCPFTAEHHGGDKNAATWLPSIDREIEFSILDRSRPL